MVGKRKFTKDVLARFTAEMWAEVEGVKGNNEADRDFLRAAVAREVQHRKRELQRREGLREKHK